MQSLKRIKAERYYRIFCETGNLEHLNRAVRLLREVVETAFAGSQELPYLLNDLGVALSVLYEQSGSMNTLEEAIQRLRQGVEQAPPGSDVLAYLLSNLGNVIRNLYECTGNLDDLDQAIHIQRRAIVNSKPGTPDWSGFLNNLSIGLMNRYERKGNLQDLEEAIDGWKQAIEDSSPRSTDLPGILNAFGSGLRIRYEYTGKIGDLEQAIQAHREAVKQVPRGSPDLPGFLNNLGSALKSRYERTRELSDLERAVQVHKQAVDQAPKSLHDLPGLLNNLGSIMMLRYQRTGDLDDLEMAIHAHKKAADQVLPDSLELSGILNNLSCVLGERFKCTGLIQDLDQAIQSLKKAVEQTPNGSPGLPGILDNLGSLLLERYEARSFPANLEEAIACYEEAWKILQTSFPIEAVSYKLGGIRKYREVPAQLVVSLLRKASEHPSEASIYNQRAVIVAEGSKSRMLSELLSRSELPVPPIIPPDIQKRERDFLSKLAGLDTIELSVYGHQTMQQEERRSLGRLQQRNQYHKELVRLWKVMEQFGSKAERYLALRRGDPPSWGQLLRLTAELGPETAVLSLFTTHNLTLLFVLRQGEYVRVVKLALSDADWAKIILRFTKEIYEYDGIKQPSDDAWDHSLRPLLEKAAAHLSDVVRIIFVPHAYGHLIPWSVVTWNIGWRTSDGLQIPLVTLPALGLMPRLKAITSFQGDEVLVAGNPLGELKYAEHEVSEVAKMLETQPLLGTQVTKNSILRRLPEASIVHLATHAYFAPASPLDSGIVMTDGVLTGREIISHRLNADLIVLSACQTGVALPLAGDEIAGLAQVFLYAGARSLLLSLWAIDDAITANLMIGFYKARQSGADKARALSLAMTDLRAQEPALHPYYWGSFLLMGDWN